MALVSALVLVLVIGVGVGIGIGMSVGIGFGIGGHLCWRGIGVSVGIGSVSQHLAISGIIWWQHLTASGSIWAPQHSDPAPGAHKSRKNMNLYETTDKSTFQK